MNRRLVLQLLGAAPAWAQGSKRPSEPPRSRESGSSAVIDAVVTDDAGKPVRDLQPADFVVTEAGQDKKLTSFAAVDAVSGASRAAPPLPLPDRISPAEVHRNFVLLVDDAGLGEDEVGALHASLIKFVEEQLGPRDVAAVFRSSGGTAAAEQLTSDKNVLRHAIDDIVFNPAAKPPALPPWPGTLRFALEALRRVQGRKAVVVFWRAETGKSDFAPIITLANRAFSSIYPVCIAGSAATPPSIEALASQTAGIPLREPSSAALPRVLEDQAYYYLLGFESSRVLADEPVVLKLSNPGLTLRARNSLPSMRSPATLTYSGSASNDLVAAMTNPFGAGPIRIRVFPVFGHSGGSWLDVTTNVDGRDVSVTHRLNGTYEGALDLLLRVVDVNGNVVNEHTATQTLRMKESEYKRMLAEGLSYAVRMPVPRPGVFQARAAVRDTTNARTGLAWQLAEVPDLSAGTLTLSGLTLEPAAAADSNPVANAVSAARRVFSPGQQLTYQCSVFNVKPNSEGMADLEMRSRMYRGAQIVYTGNPLPLSTKLDAGTSTLVVRGSLTVGAAMSQGALVFEVLVTDKAGGGKTASQWTEFTLKS